MAANTILLDFSVDPASVRSEAERALVANNLENLLRDYLPGVRAAHAFAMDGSSVRLYTCAAGGLVTVRVFDNGLVTLNIEYYKADDQEPIVSYEKTKSLRETITDKLAGIVMHAHSLLPIRRNAVNRYFPSSDDRLLEYDIDKVVFDEKTPYQRVLIVHSKTLGNMLVLDDLQNISEADLIYTETLMNRGKENYRDKEIVILGGGDGALLYELLKEEPKHVVMLEIDDVVMKACSKHMKSICGDVLETYDGPNYQIIVDDCLKSLELFVKQGRKFDYVFGDLTDIPISETPTGELWNFILKILQLSFKILKPDGKFMTHGNGKSSIESLAMYEQQLRKLSPPVSVSKTTAFVPSFLEDWVFYQIGFAGDA